MERQLSISQHLLELRKRILISGAAVLIGTVVALVFYEDIIELLLRPADELSSDDGPARLIYTELTEMIGVTVRVSILGGLILAFPVVLYQVIMFVAPGLTKRERRFLLAFMPGVILSFIGGVAFGYFVLIPAGGELPAELGQRLGHADDTHRQLRLHNGDPAVLAGCGVRDPGGDVPACKAGGCVVEDVRKMAAVLDTGGLHPWSADHPHLRSGEPGAGGCSLDCAVRAGDMAVEVRRQEQDAERSRG